MSQEGSDVSLIDLEPSLETFRRDVLSGLRNSPKRLPCKYFYDDLGCQLFDRICELEEYYPTRTELEIMNAAAGEMADRIGPDALVIEYGSGSSVKTRVLLDALHDPAAYMPVDIARDHLEATAQRMSVDYPALHVVPVCADFVAGFEVPDLLAACRMIYFPGSTIGNFTPAEARRLLERMGEQVGPGGGLLIGIDLHKPADVLEAAYNDSSGVTAAFNLNLLTRMNRELDAGFELEDFEHYALYNPVERRIEIYVRSLKRQSIEVAGETFFFDEGELVHTEFSYKHEVSDFANLAAAAGLRLDATWTDDREWFAVLLLERAA